MNGREFAESTADTANEQPRSVTAAPHALLALQATAGNRAVTRMLAVQREPLDAPVLDSRAMAVTVGPELEKERASVLAAYETADEPQREALRDKLLQIDKDLTLLNEPGASDQALNALIARRKAAVSVGPTTDTSGAGWQVGSSGLTSSSQSVTSQVNDGGYVQTSTTTSSTTIDSTGWANKKSETNTLANGSDSASQTTTTDRKVDIANGLNYTSGSSQKTEASGESRTTGSSSTVGTSGYSTTTEDTKTVGSTVDSTKSTSAITRGDGKLGWSDSETRKTGTQDGKGALTKGSETTSSSNAGVIAGPDGVGAYGGGSKSFTQTRAKGMSTGQTVGLDGKVVANVTQVPGSEPARYQVTLTVSLSGKAGLSGNAAGESELQGGKASGGLSGSVSASGTGTFVHVFNEDEAQKYMASVTAGGAGSGPKELQVIKQLAAGNLADAKALLTNAQASLMSADGVAGLKEGESGEITIDLKGEVGGNLGGDMAGFGVKGTASGSKGVKLKRSVARKGGKIVIDVAMDYTDSLGAGATVSMDLASGGYSGSKSETQTEGATFTLDPDNRAYQEQFDAIAGVRSVESLRHVAQTHKDLVSSSTTGSGHGTTSTATAGAAGVGVEIGTTNSYDEKVTVGEYGKTSTFTGTEGGSLALTGPGGVKVSHSETNTVSASVGIDGTATGDLSTTTSGTDLGGSAAALGKALTDNKLGLLTGSAKVMQETTEVCGMALSDGDFATIAAVAEEVNRWKKVEQDGDVYSDWIRLRFKIVKAKGDRTVIAKALAEYGADHEGATKAIGRIVRSVGSAQGGTLYDWPGALSAEKAQYAALITGDPLAPVREHRSKGTYAEGIQVANALLPKIDAVVTAMRANQDKFSDGTALGEMLAAAATRRGEIVREAASLRQLNGGGAAEVDVEAAKAELAGIQPALLEFERRQGKAFVTVQDELDDMYVNHRTIMEALNDLRDNVYPAWEKTLEQARKAAASAGLDPWAIQPTPGKGFFNQLHKEAFGGPPPYEWPPKPKP
ncbi:hypothetical protein LWC34_43725 [Kibdelosporangium philippinense]|uniref:Uncharacterized protein n=1 Tax=Kibdelosporangium philippinense TaxID=211113 RepID=A0ABS8ZR44_9PSEU|nr:hypothetical protein [Kibdelosporangium philippinense]MCE7009673.1 hypothetical protein [Kibdelosporangium philippinense]